MHRLFVALRPPAPIRSALTEIMAGVPHARWQDDDQLHLTLRYIGEVERPVAEDIAMALARVRGRAATVALSGVGVFDTRGRVDTLWAGVSPAGALARLHAKIDHALVGIGLRAESRAYRPHITVARLARGSGDEEAIARWRADHAMLSSAPFTLDRLTLYESHLGRTRASYEAVAQWALEP